YGTGTVNAVKRFQTDKGLSSDGAAGANTMYALYN
ncbi:MAG: peptidoglycan-binding protein, partial [Lachnospiraceae bacterium]|nr:peptidoglycan-binding protein [Lachnospiraceae bacterium]